MAGAPYFPRNFTRDSIISGILMQDAEVLRNQLLFSALKQGMKKNPFTGEEYGKIFHEYPGVVIDAHSTEYSACDTTALFLIGHHYYWQLTGDATLKEKHREHIVRAADYIKSHLIDYIFYEDPKLSDADRFALKVTYWKDSEIAKRTNGVPVYPVTYFLAHVINMAGMRYASKLVDSQEYLDIAHRMRDNVHKFFDKEKKSFYMAIDSQGPIEAVSSDIPHALFYLDIGDLTEDELKMVEESSSELETSIGYLTLSPKLQGTMHDNYHAITVWPFEQAIINIGAKKFQLARIEEASRRIISYLDTAPEIFILTGDAVKKGGCDPQLWTLAAKKYFGKP